VRTLILSPSFPPVLGGLQTVVHNLAQHLQQHHQVYVVTQRYPRTLPAKEVYDGIAVQRLLFLKPDLHMLRRRRPDLFLASFYYAPAVLIQLANLMRTYQPDVVNIHFPDVQIPFVIWLRRRFAFRLVVSLHGDDIERWFDSESSPAISQQRGSPINQLRWLLREADGITACSFYLLNRTVQLEPSVAQKARVIHNGIEPHRFMDKTPYCYPRPYIFAFGRLTHKKGIDLLLAAFSQIMLRHKEVDLLIAGDGEERDALQAQVAELGIGDRVRLVGRASPPEIVRMLNGCLLAVMPSRQEPFGIAALEVLAAGKPLLATRVGGVSEFVPQPPNLLVDPSVGALQAGLLELLDTVGQRRSDLWINCETAGKYTWQAAMSAYANVLESKQS
jgi:glycogen(starch) synthase